MADYGINGETGFRHKNGKASVKRAYMQLKSGGSYLRCRQRDERRFLMSKTGGICSTGRINSADAYLMIRNTNSVIQWINVGNYLREWADKDGK